MLDSFVFGFYIVINIMFAILSPLFYYMDHDNLSKEPQMCIAFIILTYDSLKPRINKAGLIIAMTFVAIITAPSIIILFPFWLLFSILHLMWILFLKIFEKKEFKNG